MLDDGARRLVAQPAPPIPVGQLVKGKQVDEVAALMPRVFNLCRAAQERAVRLALGLPVTTDFDALNMEILRDHLMRFYVVLPRHFGQAPATLPPDWRDRGDGLATALFGPAGRMPDSADGFDTFLSSGATIAVILRKIADLFGPVDACCRTLPLVDAATAFDPCAAVENTIPARQADHPVMRAVEQRWGRGPLWRVVGRAYDLQDLLGDGVDQPPVQDKGAALVTATRGCYSVRAKVEGKTVKQLDRVTPTDHLVAAGGVLESSLAALPPDRYGLAPLLLDILDPCSPIRLTEVPHA